MNVDEGGLTEGYDLKVVLKQGILDLDMSEWYEVLINKREPNYVE